ncbi:chemotaxis protein CheY [Microbacterium sp. P05]|uniref:chemotaxis protein CheY n=1 Tax=Microbacterium sp. P05 TaxID=3366948 RepID=UPI0037466B7F
MTETVHLVWAAVADGDDRRDVAWSLIRTLVPAARISNPCPFCGGPHGPVRLDDAPLLASVTYAGVYAIVGLTARANASRLGIDAEPLVDGVRDRAGLTGVLGRGRPADVRAWTRVEAALKADGRGLRIEPAEVEVTRGASGWAARVPGRYAPLSGFDLTGPPGIVVSAALVTPAALLTPAALFASAEPLSAAAAATEPDRSTR